MRHPVLYLAILLTVFACQSPKEEEIDNSNKTFFPIAGNIGAELKALDSMPIAITKYTRTVAGEDTAIIEKSALREAAGMMLQPDITAPEWKKYFKETVMMDNTVNVITMSYTTDAEKPAIRKIEVMIDPQSEKLKSIYVEKTENGQDSTVNRKMIWTVGKNFQVITLTNKPGKPEEVKTEKYVWGIE